MQPRLTPELDDDGDDATLAYELEMRSAERRWITQERAAVSSAARKAPRDADGFIAWFERLKNNGPGRLHPLFSWLATSATVDEMRWFLSQERGAEAGFEDLVALTQVRMPAGPKLAMTRNFWDEMGQGHAAGVHASMLDQLATQLRLGPTELVWESLALSNTMTTLATNRDYAYQSVGALGVIELTEPGRARLIDDGLVRLGIEGTARRYFALHATVDVKHAAAWTREVLRPLIVAEPRCAQLIAEGALLRLAAGARCFARYEAELQTSAKLETVALQLVRPPATSIAGLALDRHTAPLM